MRAHVKGEPANFLLSNAYLERDYFFGICIEQQENVRSTLEQTQHNVFHKMLSSLPDDFSIDLEYIDTYRPREVSWTVLSKSVRDITIEDAEWIVNYCKEINWKIRLLIMKKVWDRDEILSRHEHLEKIEKVKHKLLPMRQELTH